MKTPISYTASQVAGDLSIPIWQVNLLAGGKLFNPPETKLSVEQIGMIREIIEASAEGLSIASFANAIHLNAMTAFMASIILGVDETTIKEWAGMDNSQDGATTTLSEKAEQVLQKTIEKFDLAKHWLVL